MHEWSARNHTLFRIQGYGLPPAAISSYALADLPEGEGHALEDSARLPLGRLGQPHPGQAGDVVGNLDLAALARRSAPPRRT